LKNILVGLKRVVDYNVRVQVKNDCSEVETDGVKMSINPFDEIALEEALRIKEANQDIKVTVLSIGIKEAQQQLRTGLAMGADHAILVENHDPVSSLDIAKIFKLFANRDNIDLVILGKQAIDTDNNQTAQMLSALLDCPQATFASKLDIKENKAIVTREVDSGLEVLEIDLPAVISADLRLNEPRYVKLPDIMKAKKKIIETIKLSDLNITQSPQIKNLKFEPPEERASGIKVDDVAGLVSILKERGLV
tara:strand:+ start:401 stop:1150 length:750 start_codon:yes stop_codon:yes gene_type:complete